MTNNGLQVISGPDVRLALKQQEQPILEQIAQAYICHGNGQASLPNSSFLRFAQNSRNRIIALPGYLGGDFDVAGIKWISSFPENIDKGIDRASALQVLNDMETGRPKAVFEASTISAKRTAASAALAASKLHKNQSPRIGLIGTGYINFEILNFLLHVFPDTQEVLVNDTDPAREKQFVSIAEKAFEDFKICRADSQQALLQSCDLIVFATNVGTPFIHAADSFLPCATILNVSLRDLGPQVILDSINVVDSFDHVCRENTSIHMAYMQCKSSDFVHAELHQLLQGTRSLPEDDNARIIFSPFGLGVLDLALAQFTLGRTETLRQGIQIEGFFPPAWHQEYL